MVQMAMAIKPMLGLIPPEPTSWNPKELYGLASVGNHFRRLGDKLVYDLAKLMTMSSADFLDEWFETEVLKATMSASGIIGTFMGPRSPGTAYVLYTTTWASSTVLFVPGGSPAAGWAPLAA